ncbi:molybdenum cofactor biosynthesis protein [Leptolyngbya sp. BL0902]|uniref:MogA/MoaB family molybdenum cofactor biosynthesis protein n=1 Tax=Leptolyngbya sp. BL0902 TaxID=1115757 RepID=UPI0018E806F3|nr:MogA/MoaB family molybdenum cofactor biosynthesis protein [Leptolyngbya sp. BL0902]QQE66024.1 molybdenum cofactor biosynthesis protein [Leptolyngbya sp. BL0902]
MAHPRSLNRPLCCAVLTVSDTRTPDTDQSGALIQARLAEVGHQITDYRIVADEPALIRDLVVQWGQRRDLDAVIVNGGTGIAPRDTTYDALEALLEKTLPGFGELFRQLSFQEIGSRAMASRAVAGVYQDKLLFSLPGSSKAVKLAMDALIVPELPHLVSLLRG